ncbi:MAG: hypothetical protein IPL55_21455 [Saprospiraceae bacterium]|jgi:hypothetical protein|nr:hypothetical protein [Saprospiraceae bacterium]
MGYKIETYSLAELNRISTPGKVVPALFWLIPVGQWDSYNLERLWHHFTRESSRCNELGLMLVKNANTWNANNDSRQTSDLSDLTGKLSDLLPSGVRTIYDNEYLSLKEKTNQVLILAGSYPQPGWGVLLSLENYRDIEILLEKTLQTIDHNVYSVFNEASKNFKIWNTSKRDKPIKGDIETLKRKQQYCIELYNILEKLIAEHNVDHLNNFYYETLKKFTNNSDFKEYSEIIEPLFDKVNDKFILSLLLLKSLKDIDEELINSTLIRFILEHDSKINNLFKLEKSEQLKKIASLLLKLNDVEKPKEKFTSWAQSVYYNRINEIKESVLSLKTKFQSLVGELLIKIENFESVYALELKEWQDKVEQNRLSFHKTLQEVLKKHLEYGPTFLIHLEKQERHYRKLSKSVSWDPPRMIGWKLLTEGIKIARFDITTLLKEMIPEFSNQLNDEANVDETLVNGSLFTDYIHYISKSDPKLSPRSATKNLLEKLMRPAEIMSILRNCLTNISPNQTPSQLVESLLVEFGWPIEKDTNEKKLVECIEVYNGKNAINKSFSGNDIRIICESFCKDLVDTLSSKIGYSEEELLNLISSRFPEYKSQNRGWNYEVTKMTIGSSLFILSALLNEALPDKKIASEYLIQNLRELSRKLNPVSHHPPIEIDTLNLVDEIFNIIKYTKELISEMPWHFYPIQRNGLQPTVLTGDAWSHSHKQNRQLSIIIWSNDISSESMLVWNPGKVNPVIPDGIIINRP